MIGIMSADEIEAMLQRHAVGRIGCSAGDRPYVVPITYAYDGANIYSYSTPGRKIDVMRAQPRVCFEVDEIDGPTTWRSVIVEGIYEEVTDEAARREALARLLPTNGRPVPRGLDGGSWIVIFRLRLAEKSGRFERRDA